ncbi:hypothetical protein B0H10DRAFT_1185542 [Mycena sp. CBHHK59/15]|nr:hypothetical protein B0H10DRAFT_1185542 [Mycena sp. CBHHK59/15]
MAMNSSIATTALSPEEELQALVTTVSLLAQRSNSLTKTCLDLQGNVWAEFSRHLLLILSCLAKLPGIIDRIARPLPPPPAPSDLFVRGVHKTPVEVELENRSGPDGANIAWYVVWIGREPGIYTSVDDANTQVKGCPNQQCRRKTGKHEALQFYTQLYAVQKVEKWTEVTD